MNSENCNAVASNSLKCAKMYCESQNYGRAFSHYLIVLKLMPAWKTELKETVSTVLYKWGKTLERQKRYSDLFNCYEQAIEVFPENEFVLNNLGGVLLKYGLIKEAAHYFRKSLEIRPQYLRARRNLENVSNLVVQRWHFRMLNDIKRNTAFREAIWKKIKQGYDTVLDIGTGTSILSLFALEAGPKNITACDSSSFMFDIATQVVAENNADCIKLINKHSTELNIPEDLPEKVKLIVTEIVDCGLFGENILQTLIHAWDCLLLTPASVVPYGARLFVAGVECYSIRRKHFATEHARNRFNFEGCNILNNDGNYDSECLKRFDFKYLTEPYESFFINFNDSQQMKRMLTGECDQNLTFSFTEKGILDCLVVWFDLYIDEDIKLCTGSESDSCDSWDQAVFPIPCCVNVTKNDQITFKMSFLNGKLEFHYIGASPIVDNVLNKCEHLFNVSEDLVKMLNNVVYADVLSETCVALEEKKMENLCLLDDFPFPFLGLNYLIRNRDSVLTCVTNNENDKSFIKYIAKKYELESHVYFISEDEIFELDRKFDVILVRLVDSRGEIRDKIVENLDNLRSHLNENGVLLPEKATIVGQLIDSEWLANMTRVTNDSHTLGYKIANFINIYQVKSHIDFDLNTTSKYPRSESFNLCDIVPSEYSKNISVTITEGGNVNALAYWFDINFLRGSISTLNDGMTNHSALLLPDKVLHGVVNLAITYDNGLFGVELSIENTI